MSNLQANSASLYADTTLSKSSMVWHICTTTSGSVTEIWSLIISFWMQNSTLNWQISGSQSHFKVILETEISIPTKVQNATCLQSNTLVKPTMEDKLIFSPQQLSYSWWPLKECLLWRLGSTIHSTNSSPVTGLNSSGRSSRRSVMTLKTFLLECSSWTHQPDIRLRK